MHLTIILLFVNFLSFAQTDSISPRWNNCQSDTAFSEAGNILEIKITQQEWSKSKKQSVTAFWQRKFIAKDIVIYEYKGTKYYSGQGDLHYEGTKKIFNSKGRRTGTEQVHYKVPPSN